MMPSPYAHCIKLYGFYFVLVKFSTTFVNVLRHKGKVSKLALGYQDASGALIAMGALKMGLTEEDLPEIVNRWRALNKRIVDLWYSLENAALEVMRTGQRPGFCLGHRDMKLYFIKNHEYMIFCIIIKNFSSTFS